VQEEIILGQSSGSSSSPQILDKEDLDLASKGNGKAKKKGGKNKDIDISKVKCFQCHKMGHFSSHCPEKKKKNQPQMAASTTVDEFSKSFEEYFLFIACMSSTTMLTAYSTRGQLMCHEDMHHQMQVCRRQYWFYLGI
jgi:hypothetical protein